MDSPAPEQDGDGPATVPGLARLAASTWLRTSGWALQSSIRASRRVAEASVSPEKASELLRDVRGVARAVLRDLLELSELDERVGAAGPAMEAARRVAEAVGMPGGDLEEERHGLSAMDGTSLSAATLREEGEALLRRSRDVHYEEEAHPAYERILLELAPDEARILRLLLLSGPQPSVDVRTGGPIGLVRSRLIAPGLSMIGARSGCRYVERVPAYLNNLFRLGMIWFSRETLQDPLRYQVLEAQPDVLAAIHSVRHAKVVRRSIHLTPFGEDFCRVSLCPNDTVGDDLPHHGTPPGSDHSPQPPADVHGGV